MPPARLCPSSALSSFLPGNPGWMKTSLAHDIMTAARKANGEARFVGGCVRDHLMDRPVGDIDMAITLSPEACILAMQQAGLRTIPTGLDHGTITVVGERDGKKFSIEMTSLRRDVEGDGRHAIVAFTDDWQADSQRRDFTMNALYADQEGRIYDYHNGLRDLTEKRLRFIGKAGDRIQEDVLRILRFFRFQAQLGLKIPELKNPESDGLDVCIQNRHLLPKLSAERVAKEIRKLLSAEAPGPVLRIMAQEGVLEYWLPEAQGFDSLDRLIDLEDLPDPVRRLSILCGEAGAEAASRLKLSNRDRDRLARLGQKVSVPETAHAARRFLYEHGQDLVRDYILQGQARGEAGWQIAGDLLVDWKRPVFPLGGKDALAVGIKPGPEVGILLEKLERAWIDSDFTLDRRELIAMLQKVNW